MTLAIVVAAELVLYLLLLQIVSSHPNEEEEKMFRTDLLKVDGLARAKLHF